jgi:rhodanese-related sulfurtransferase
MTMTERFTVNDLLAEARAALTRLTPEQAYAAHQQGALILDTRIEAHREHEGVIPGSIHAPLSVVQWVVDPASGYPLPEIEGFNQTLIVICNEGYSSSLAAASLKRLGFVNATDLNGGYRGWKAHGYPTCSPRDAQASVRVQRPVRVSAIKGLLYRVFLRVFQ